MAGVSAAAALDKAAVLAMVSVVGSYTLDALLDCQRRTQHKQQCAERLMRNAGQQLQHSEKKLLASLDSGIDALEEAIATGSQDTKIAKLDQAEKLLKVCALLDSQATACGVPNGYLSAWAHLNLAFVWKMRNDDRMAADHMLAMFFLDPLYSRVDFAPALWEHLFLPHLPNIVNWYAKQRQSILAKAPGVPAEKNYDMSLSRSTSEDPNNLQVNVLKLSVNQTSQLQALEKLYQESLDESTRQYAKYYKDWLNCDLTKKKEAPLVPNADPPSVTRACAASYIPVPDTWGPTPCDMPHSPVSAGSTTSSVGRKLREFGVEGSSSPSSYESSIHFDSQSQYKAFHNPEFVETTGLDERKNQIWDNPNFSNYSFGTTVRESDFPTNAASSMPPYDPQTLSPPGPGTSCPDFTSIEMNPLSSGGRTPTSMVDDSEANTQGDTTAAIIDNDPMSLTRLVNLPRLRMPRIGQRSREKILDPVPNVDVTVAAAPAAHEPDCNSLPCNDSVVDWTSMLAKEQGRDCTSPRICKGLGSGRGMANSNGGDAYSYPQCCITEDLKVLTVESQPSMSGQYHEGGFRTRFVDGPEPRGRGNSFVNSNETTSNAGWSVFSPVVSDEDLSDHDITSKSDGSQDRQAQEGTHAGLGLWEQNYANEFIRGSATASSSGPPSLRFISRHHENEDEPGSVSTLAPGCRLNVRDDVDDDEDELNDEESCLSTSPHPASITRYMRRARDRSGSTPNSKLVMSAEKSGLPADHASLAVNVLRKTRHVIVGHNRQKSWDSSSTSGSSRGICTQMMATPLTKPPKDFVCPITGQVFNDPVTLETGQTYERKAIQEWIRRGNLTCPITRQMLRIPRINGLPQTNFVLKRLLDCWKEQNPDVAVDLGRPLRHDDHNFPRRNLKNTRKAFEETFREPESPHSDPSYSLMESLGRDGGRRAQSFNQTVFLSNDVKDQWFRRPTGPGDIKMLITDLKLALTCLCSSENLSESESLILHIAALLQEVRGDQEMIAILNKGGVVGGMLDVLSHSTQVMVLSAILFLLSSLISKDNTTKHSVLRADPHVECLTGLLRKGFTLSVVVLNQLELPIQQLISLDLLPLLLVVVKKTDENPAGSICAGNLERGLQTFMMSPKSAAVILLEQIVTSGIDPSTPLMSGQTLLVLQAVPALVSRLSQTTEMAELERTSLISLLLYCMESDGRNRTFIAQTSTLASVVELLQRGNSRSRTIAISFLSNLVRLNRRDLCDGILRGVKAEGNLSSMHAILVHLQTAPLKCRPVAASFLLHLDLLEEPRRRSIYRDEAVESLVEALTNAEWPCQVEAADALVALCGRFSSSGRPMIEAWLLKTAGLDKPSLEFMIHEHAHDSSDNVRNDQEEEENAVKACHWEKRVAGALVGHDLGALFEALGQGIQSKSPEVSKPCVVVAAWLSHLLPVLPDTGIRQTARSCLLDHFVGVLKFSKEFHQRVLAALAIHGFTADSDGVEELLSYVKDIYGPLRQLKKSTWVAKRILQILTAHAETNLHDLWVYSEQGQLDNSAHGEVRTLARVIGRIFSGHSDGTIKVWDVKKTFPVLLQERKEHSKSVTALTAPLNSDRLYSASLDKSIRVWTIGPEHIHVLQMFEMKDAIAGMAIHGPTSCTVPQGTGIKVQCEEDVTKSLNAHKNVQSIAISDKGQIYCGCTDNSIQKLDPVSGSIDSLQHGVRILLGKRAIYAMQVFEDHLYMAGSPVDGIAGKVWKLSDHSLIGNLRLTVEVRSMVVSEDFIILGLTCGIIEVWHRERLSKVASLNVGSKVISLILDGDTLYSGSEDGRIRVWTMT